MPLKKSSDSQLPSIDAVYNFCEAARSGKIADVRKYLDLYGAVIINKNDDNNNTALSWAAWYGHTDVVALLLERGADIDKTNMDGDTALLWSVYNGHIDVVALLLEHDADINKMNMSGETALILSAWHGRIDIVRLLLEHDADINKTDMIGNTALMNAEQAGHDEAAELLRGWLRLLEQRRLAEENSRKNMATLAAEKQTRDLTNERLEKLKTLRPVKSPLKKTPPHQP